MTIPTGFRPMLAEKLPGGAVPQFPCYVSPKIDGVRAINFDCVYSRQLKPIPNKFVQAILQKAALQGLDGELTVGDPTDPKVYSKTVSGVMAGDGTPDFTFRVFDVVESWSDFEKRMASMEKIVARAKTPRIQIVPQRLVHDEQELLAAEMEFLSQGYEGAMVRAPGSPYKFGRSTVKEGYLLKIKRFSDSEAEVLGWEEQEHNGNEGVRNAAGKLERSSSKAGKTGMGVLGNLLARDIKTGVEFSVGSGFDLAERIELWKIRETLRGKIFTYRFFAHGVKDKPRHPVFHGWRAKIDL